MPKATTIAMLLDPSALNTNVERSNVQAAAKEIGLQLVDLDASSDRDIESAFATFVQRGAGALLVGSVPFLSSHREQLVALAVRYALPMAYNAREFVAAHPFGGVQKLIDQELELLDIGIAFIRRERPLLGALLSQG